MNTHSGIFLMLLTGATLGFIGNTEAMRGGGARGAGAGGPGKAGVTGGTPKIGAAQQFGMRSGPGLAGTQARMHTGAQRMHAGVQRPDYGYRRPAGRDIAGMQRAYTPYAQRAIARARNPQLARQLSPQRTFSHTGRFGQFRTPQRLGAQRHFLNRNFRGHNWSWWWHHRPYFFYTYFPFFFYNTYGYYPPIYYDYFDAYGSYPTTYSYTAPVNLSVDQRACVQNCLETTTATLESCLSQCGAGY